MPKFIADFHIHSRYSRACSKDLSVPELAKWAKIKGIGVMGTGDFTHPLWQQELRDTLRETGRGMFEHAGVDFMLTAEVNTLFYKGGKCHQIHHILFVPDFEAMDRVCKELAAFGKLSLDGRPMLRMEPARLVELLRGADPRCVVVPAHAWTPWFGIFGSTSGFNAVEECFEDQAQHIFALETGLSSDPSMNWRWSALDHYALISNSDSHSAKKIGREANRFDCERSYDGIMDALRTRDARKFLGTIEFFPEEGKYHYDGHRACRVRWTPAETKAHGGRCSACGRKVTVGVMHRVDALADRPDGAAPARTIPFVRSVPLEEIIAHTLEMGVGTKAVQREYWKLIDACGTEFGALLESPADGLRRATTPEIAHAILQVREGRVAVEPGYDGEYGTVRVLEEPAHAVTGEQTTLLA